MLRVSLILGLSVSPTLGLSRESLTTQPTDAEIGTQSAEIVKGPLKTNAKHEAMIAGGEAHLYTLDAKAGQYARVTAEQIGIDLVVTILDSEGRKVASVDRPSGAMGAEDISHVAQRDSEYWIKINPLMSTASRGRYEITLSELRAAEPLDETVIVAQRLVTHAEELRSKSTAESLKLAAAEFDHSIDLWRALKASREESIALYGLGWCYNPQGEYQRALSCFNRSLKLGRASGDRAAEALAISGAAWTYLYLGGAHEALRAFQQSIELRRAYSDLAGEATCLNGVGWCHIFLNDPEMALESLNRARMIRQSQHDLRGEGITLNSIGMLYHRTGRNQEALGLLKQSVDRLRCAGYLYGEANTLSNIGWTYLAMMDSRLAADYFEQALTLRRKVGDRAGESNTLYGLACALEKRGDLPNALDKMEAALAIVEIIRAEGRSYDLNSYFFASVQDYYEFQIDLLMQLDRLHPNAGHAKRALHVAERARARSILDLLSEARVDIRQGVNPLLLEEERDLQRKLNINAGLLAEKRSVTSAHSAAIEIDTLTAKYRQVEADIRASSPRYAALTQPQPYTADQIQRELLDRDTLLLEYALGERRSLLWVVGKDSLQTVDLPPRDKIEAAAREFYHEISSRNGGSGGKVRGADPSGAFSQAAMNLSRMILAPAAGYLSNKRLAIVPHGALHYVPFGALPLDAADGNERSRRASTSQSRPGVKTPLVANHEVVILLSASTLAILRRDLAYRIPAPKSIAIFGDPVYSTSDQRMAVSPPNVHAQMSHSNSPKATPPGPDRTTATSFSSELPRLFLGRKEADEILALAPRAERMRAVDFDANRTTAMSDALSHYRIIHFAVHTLVDNDHPDLSLIALSRFDSKGKPRDGSLFANEIFNLKLAADLVVLSSCRTGLGKEIKGEGLMSLTRSFMYAGARRVIVSLWSVDDRATAELMVRFYRKMLGPDRLSASAALRAAQVEMHRHPRWHSPYFWAGFILQGEWL